MYRFTNIDKTVVALVSETGEEIKWFSPSPDGIAQSREEQDWLNWLEEGNTTEEASVPWLSHQPPSEVASGPA